MVVMYGFFIGEIYVREYWGKDLLGFENDCN
jgi:hypothetical protein